MANLTFKAQKREEIGTNASRRLRKMGKLPATVYGGNKPSLAIIIEHDKFIEAERAGILFNNLLDLDFGNKTKETVIIKGVQRHPFKPLFLHFDFLRTNEKEEITVTVPVNVLGAEEIMKQGAVVTTVIQELEISCLPGNIPEHIEIDITGANIGDSFKLKDLNVPDDITVKLFENEEALEWAVVNIEHQRSEEELEGLDEPVEAPEESVDAEEKTEDTEDASTEEDK